MRSRGRFFSVFIFGLFFFAAGCMNQNSKDLSAESGTLSGSQLFTLRNLDGQDTSLEILLKRNKAVLLNFWATWCPPCREEIPELMKLQETYQDRAFTVLGIDVGESAAKVSSFVKKEGINYPIVLDSNSEVTEGYGVVGIPTSFLIRSDGKVLGVYHVFTRQLVADIERILKE